MAGTRVCATLQMESWGCADRLHDDKESLPLRLRWRRKGARVKGTRLQGSRQGRRAGLLIASGLACYAAVP